MSSSIGGGSGSNTRPSVKRSQPDKPFGHSGYLKLKLGPYLWEIVVMLVTIFNRKAVVVISVMAVVMPV